jgi:hypothetical protein
MNQMIRKGHEGVNFFYGTEVEHTPAYGKYTMFVVGVQSIADITQALASGSQPVEHIYFGANHSFPQLAVNDGAEWAKWEMMIYHFLEKEHLCTLDIDVGCTEGLLEAGFVEYHNFIPMISVKLPYILQLGYNAVVKLDDKDFNATTPGVWCHQLHDLLDRKVFTEWSKYTKDEIL